MRSNRKALYESLGNLTVDVEKALQSDDQDTLDRLALCHDQIMETLVRGGDETDADMKDTIKDADMKIRKLISTIQTMQADIKSQLSTMNNRRLIQSRYQSKDAR